MLHYPFKTSVPETKKKHMLPLSRENSPESSLKLVMRKLEHNTENRITELISTRKRKKRNSARGTAVAEDCRKLLRPSSDDEGACEAVPTAGTHSKRDRDPRSLSPNTLSHEPRTHDKCCFHHLARGIASHEDALPNYGSVERRPILSKKSRPRSKSAKTSHIRQAKRETFPDRIAVVDCFSSHPDKRMLNASGNTEMEGGSQSTMPRVPYNTGRSTSLSPTNRLEGEQEGGDIGGSIPTNTAPIFQNSSITAHNTLTHLFHTPLDIDDETLSQNSDHSFTEGDSASEAGKKEFFEENFGARTSRP